MSRTRAPWMLAVLVIVFVVAVAAPAGGYMSPIRLGVAIVGILLGLSLLVDRRSPR